MRDIIITLFTLTILAGCVSGQKKPGKDQSNAPQTSQEQTKSQATVASLNSTKVQEHGYSFFTNIEDAQKASEAQSKPLFILFTAQKGLVTTFDPWEILVQSEVKQFIEEHYIMTVLYADDPTPASDSDKSTYLLGKTPVKTIGEKNVSIQIAKFQTNFQPIYGIADADLTRRTLPYSEANPNDKANFLKFLAKGQKK
jgi:sRNA-binding regulator protein Hfq